MIKEIRIYNGEKTTFLINYMGKLDSYMEKNEIRTFSNTTYKKKKNLKMD